LGCSTAADYKFSGKNGQKWLGSLAAILPKMVKNGQKWMGSLAAILPKMVKNGQKLVKS
jgi:hypothetical protein